jgi:hypothetical protein
LGAGFGTLFASDVSDAGAQIFSGALAIISSAIALLFNGVVLYGALQMKKLENYTLALVAAVLFALPCSFCCIINTPIGIWAIVLLVDQNIKSQFKS